MTEPVPPGWYRDPDDPQALRYWDGEAWVQASAQATAAGPRQSHRGALAGVGVLLLVIVGVVAVVYAVTKHHGSSPPAAVSLGPVVPSTHQIVYLIGGDAGGADLTLSMNGQQSQQQGVAVPLENKSGSPGIRFTADDGEFLYVSAQNDGSAGDTITCEIREDGVTVASNSSSGPYAIVTCQGTA